MLEAIVCFEYISDNVPSWISTLEALESTVREKHSAISRIPVPARKLKKTGSNESIRPRCSSGEGKHLESMASAPQDADMVDAPTTEDLITNRRKRKTTSIVSTDSLPTKFRSRNMIIVYYDSEIQKSFEQIVRNIGTARNNIRKARMANRMEAVSNGKHISGMAGVRSGYGPLMMMRSSRTSGTDSDRMTGGNDGPDDSFGMADASLEKAQSLCERGAHQFLREGDCEAEIAGAKESFEEAKRLSDKELIRLRAEQELKNEQEDQQQDEEPENEETFDANPTSNILEADSDDSDNNAEDILLNMSRFGMRSTRNMART